MSRTYTVIVERDPESGWLVAEVVELPGCYTQAADLPALEGNIREAIKGYLLATDEVVLFRPWFIATKFIRA